MVNNKKSLLRKIKNFNSYVQAVLVFDELVLLPNVFGGSEYLIFIIGIFFLSSLLPMEADDHKKKESWISAYETAQLERKKIDKKNNSKVVLVPNHNCTFCTAWIAERIGGTLPVNQFGPETNISLSTQLKKRDNYRTDFVQGWLEHTNGLETLSPHNVSVEPQPGFGENFRPPGAHYQITNFNYFDPEIDGPPTEL